jgi:hypothetical protein
MTYRIIIEKDGAEIESLDINDDQVKCLEHDLDDIGKWVAHAATHFVTRKIEACRGHLIEASRSLLEADDSVTTIPLDQDALAKQIIARPDYKDRAARDKLAEQS